MAIKNKIKVKIEDLTHDGKGVGRIENKPIFIPNTYPSEIVEVEITKEKKKFLEGKVLEIIEKSKDRIDSLCADFYRCNGCQFCDFQYEKQLEYKKNKVINNFKKFGRIELSDVEISGMENFYNYRNHVQLRVEDKNIGYVDKEKNKIFTPENCIIAPKPTGRIIEILKEYKYLEKIGLVGIRENYKSELMLILVTKEKALLDISTIISELKDIKITHIYQNFNSNPKFHYGRESEKLFGEGDFEEEILGNKFILSPTSFFQVNRAQAELLYKKGIEKLKLNKEDKVLELYCGIGTITMEIAKNSKKVLGIEYSKSSIEDAKRNAKINGISNAEFISGKVEEKLFLFKDEYNKVLLDPPRAGAEKIVIDTLKKLKPEIISYISCDSATLARDVGLLVQDGEYKVSKVEVVDMFPMSSHVECVIRLRKVK